jgi:probable F420-dependent oxidoreductase
MCYITKFNEGKLNLRGTVVKPFRFGVVLSTLPPAEWILRIRQIEKLGYSTLLWPDHFRTQWEPVAALAAAAAVTKHLNIGSLVYCVDYRHPVVLAKAAATIQLISKGRHEFGLGAGWMENDYVQAGIPFEPPKLRIERLNEALEIIRRIWTQEQTTFSGKHYNVKQVPKAVLFSEQQRPRIFVGGGGRKVLEVAARHADIVGITPTFCKGNFGSHTIYDFNLKRIIEKVKLVRESAERAGRDPDEIELSCNVFGLNLTDDPRPIREEIAARWNVGEEDIEACGLFLMGSANEIRERLERLRVETGISYIAISESNPVVLRKFANSVVRPLLQK